MVDADEITEEVLKAGVGTTRCPERSGAGRALRARRLPLPAPHLTMVASNVRQAQQT
jgi:hypothetical protein